MSTKYGSLVNPSNIPVTEKAAHDQVMNNAGGYVFKVDKWDFLKRFLILGSESGSYYASPQSMTLEASHNMIDCIKEDGPRFVNMCVGYRNRAYKRDTVIFAMLQAIKHGDLGTRQLASDMLNQVSYTGSDILMTMAMMKDLKMGSSRVKKRAILKWYTTKSADALAYQIVKYRTRNNMSHDYLWAFAHGKEKDYPKLSPILKRLHTGFGDEVLTADDSAFIPEIIKTFVKLKGMAGDPAAAAELISESRGVTWEMIPTEISNDTRVQFQLLKQMPINAMIRNLAKYTASGLLETNIEAIDMVVNKLNDDRVVSESNIHPFKIFVAAKQYEVGHGDKGSLQWSPNARIVEALGNAFKHSLLHNLPKSDDRRILVGVDISGSMNIPTAISATSAREIAIAISYIIAQYFPNAEIVPFHGEVLPQRPRALGRALSDYMRSFPLDPQHTDCSCLFRYADHMNKTRGVHYDAIICLTDSETWKGRHPFAVIDGLRRAHGKRIKTVLMPIVANRFTIQDPNAEDSYEIVGADPSMMDKLETVMSL